MKRINGKEIAQRLSNENPKIRDKIWNETKTMLNHQEIKDEDEMREIWIGIYFWYWHSDGKEYQQQVRNEITSLMDKTVISNQQYVFMYLRCGLELLEEYWDGIDYVRIVKYERLLCQMIQKYLYYIACHDWNVEMINEWNEYLLTNIVTLKKQPKSLSLAVKIADYYYDYLNDVVYIDEAPEPPAESKEALSQLLKRYLRNGRVESLHKSFVEAQNRLQTEIYQPIGLGEYVKEVVINPVKEYNKLPNFGLGMERVEKMKAYRAEKRRKRDEQRKKKEERKKRKEAKKEKEKEEKKPKKETVEKDE